MKKGKSVKILYTVHEGTSFWEAIVKSPIPNTTRLHELVSRGLMTLPEFGGLAAPANTVSVPPTGKVKDDSISQEAHQESAPTSAPLADSPAVAVEVLSTPFPEAHLETLLGLDTNEGTYVRT